MRSPPRHPGLAPRLARSVATAGHAAPAGRMPVTLAALATLGAALSAGCAQLFGLDETSEAPPVMSFSVKRYAVGASVVIEPMDLTGGTATYLVADPNDASGFRTVEVTSPGTGQWQGNIPYGIEAQLRFTLPGDPLIRHFALSARNVHGLSGYLGRLGAEAAPAGAALSFNVSFEKAYEAAEKLSWLSVGAWTQHDFVGAELPAVGATLWAPAAIPFAQSSSLSGRPHERLGSSDALLVLRHNTANVLTGVFAAPPFDMMDGANPVIGSMVAVPPDEQLAVMLDTTGPVERMAAARPALQAPQYNWSVTAAPGSAAAFTTGPALASGAVAPSTGVVPLAVRFGNPFTGRLWPSTFVWAATARRTYQQPGGLAPLVLSAVQLAISPPPNDNSTVEFSACLPTSVVVQGATLLTDGLTVTLDRSKPVTVTINVDRQDAADLYGITLIEVVNTSMTAVTLTPRFDSLNEKPTWTLPGDIFEGGKIYTIRARCIRGGFPALATGDLEQRQLPYFSGSLESGVFTVAP